MFLNFANCTLLPVPLILPLRQFPIEFCGHAADDRFGLFNDDFDFGLDDPQEFVNVGSIRVVLMRVGNAGSGADGRS